MSKEFNLPALKFESEPLISLMAGAVFVSYAASSYFAQSWSLKQKKGGLSVQISKFDGEIDFDFFGEIKRANSDEEAILAKSLPLKLEHHFLCVLPAGKGKSPGLLRMNFRKGVDVVGSAALAVSFYRGYIEVLPITFASYCPAQASTGRGGPNADWHLLDAK